MKIKEFSFRKRALSFRFAFEGMQKFFREEHNARIHLAATLTVLVAAWFFGVSLHELILLIVVTGFVWAAEIFNTAIEKLLDFLSPQYDPRVKLIKDLSAAAVLIAAGAALVTGSLIFIPKIL
jgi:diacylglycerol kinase